MSAKNPIHTIFQQEKTRAEDLNITVEGLTFDYSRHPLTQKALKEKAAALMDRKVGDFFDALWAGKPVNRSEDRAVTHHHWRQEKATSAIDESRTRMKSIRQAVQAGQLKGPNGQPFKHCVHIGIGGSDLGPRLMASMFELCEAPRLDLHFLSNIDPCDWGVLLRKIDIEATLFIFVSKSFSTLETLENAKLVKQALSKYYGDDHQWAEHCYAVTASPEKARDFGLDAGHIFTIEESVGGRFSLWAPVSLACILSYGYDCYERFLKGGALIDAHMRETIANPLKNIPAQMALIGDYYRNQLEMQSMALIPYASALALLPNYLQQLDMESNGKSVSQDGHAIQLKTGPVIFGQAGTSGQHAFVQWLHQGTDKIPVDILCFKAMPFHYADHTEHLLTNALAQADALAFGQEDPAAAPYRQFEGGRGSTLLTFEALSPQSLGMIIALYEYKIMIQGFLWGINSFDQWGVELGKKLSKAYFAKNKA